MPAAAAVALPSAAPAFPSAIWCPALTTIAIAASAFALPTAAVALAATTSALVAAAAAAAAAAAHGIRPWHLLQLHHQPV